MIKVNEDSFDNIIKNHDGYMLVYFFSDFCVECKFIYPELKKIEEKLKGIIKIVKINAFTAIKITDKNNILSLPTILFLKNGKEIDRIVGFNNYNKIAEFINKNTGLCEYINF